MTEALLQIEELTVEFPTDDGVVRAVDGVTLTVAAGEIVGVVGESGSGKSVTAMSVLGLVHAPGRKTGGRIRYRGRDLDTLTGRELRALRGAEIAMIFQDPMSALNPVVTVGRQIAEALRLHTKGLGRRAARDRAVELLALVGVPDPAARYRQYPHEFSGGMRQRAMIAMAIANDPALLIADEPTTALDVTIQAQILAVLRHAQERTGRATILITHDLGVVAELADRVVVMYAGRVVEQGDVHTIFTAPRHPYTVGLLDSLPTVDGEGTALRAIPGSPPSLIDPPAGCAFYARCALAASRAASGAAGQQRCRTERPALRPVGSGQVSACHYAEDLAAEPSLSGRDVTT